MYKSWIYIRNTAIIPEATIVKALGCIAVKIVDNINRVAVPIYNPIILLILSFSKNFIIYPL